LTIVERHLVALGQAFADQHPARRGFEPLHHLLAALIGLRHAAMILLCSVTRR
jgi:hypothetical protein